MAELYLQNEVIKNDVATYITTISKIQWISEVLYMENHYLSLENREKLTLNQVVDVDAFDENNLWANIKEGAVEVSGESLSVEKLDLDEGLLVVKGKIRTFTYIDEKPHAKGRLARLLKR